MVAIKTGGLFRLAVRLTGVISDCLFEFGALIEKLGWIFQIRDDYKNLISDTVNFAFPIFFLLAAEERIMLMYYFSTTKQEAMQRTWQKSNSHSRLFTQSRVPHQVIHGYLTSWLWRRRMWPYKILWLIICRMFLRPVSISRVSWEGWMKKRGRNSRRLECRILCWLLCWTNWRFDILLAALD